MTIHALRRLVSAALRAASLAFCAASLALSNASGRGSDGGVGRRGGGGGAAGPALAGPAPSPALAGSGPPHGPGNHGSPRPLWPLPDAPEADAGLSRPNWNVSFGSPLFISSSNRLQNSRAVGKEARARSSRAVRQYSAKPGSVSCQRGPLRGGAFGGGGGGAFFGGPASRAARSAASRSSCFAANNS